YVALCVVSAIVVKKRRNLMTIVPHAPRGNAVRDALRHTAVLRFQVDWGSTQASFSTISE
ncbi:hypothetical protein AO069_14965, partial [Pseudomonas syringae pv. syringae PD2774]